MKTKPECYGSMFPPLISLTHKQPVAGKVFGYQIDQPGIAVRSRTVTYASGEPIFQSVVLGPILPRR